MKIARGLSTGSRRGRQHAALERRQENQSGDRGHHEGQTGAIRLHRRNSTIGVCHAIPNTHSVGFVPEYLQDRSPAWLRKSLDASGIATTGESQPEGSGPDLLFPVVREDAPNHKSKIRAGTRGYPHLPPRGPRWAGEGTMEARFALAASFWRILQSPSLQPRCAPEPRARWRSGSAFFRCSVSESRNPQLAKNLPRSALGLTPSAGALRLRGGRYPRAHVGSFPGRSPALPQPRVRRLWWSRTRAATVRSPRPDADKARHGRPCRPCRRCGRRSSAGAHRV